MTTRKIITLVPFTLLLIIAVSFNLEAKAPTTFNIDQLNKEAYTLRLEDRVQAFEHAKKAKQLSEQIQYNSGAGKAYCTLGLLYKNSLQFDSAFYCLSKAKALFQHLEDIEQLAEAYRVEALTYSKLSNFKRSDACLETSLNLFEKAESISGQANALSNMGINKGKQQNYTVALDFFMRAYNLKNAIGNEEGAAAEFMNIAIVYSRMREYTAAKEYIWRAINIDLKYGHKANLGDSFNTLAGLYHYSDQYDSALIFYRKSIEHAKEYSDMDKLSLFLNNTANLYITLEKFDSAEFYIHKVLALRHKVSEKRRLYSMRTLIDIYAMQLNYDSAINYAQKVLLVSQRINEKNMVKSSSHSLSQLYEDLGEMDSALHYLKMHMEVQGSIYDENKAKLFANQRVQLETLEQEQAIARLEKQADLDYLINQFLIAIIAMVAIITMLGYKVFKNKQRRKKQEYQMQQNILKAQLEHNKSRLFNYTLTMIHKDNCMEEIRQEVRKAESADDSKFSLNKISKAITLNKSTGKEWENFNIFFSGVHKEYYGILKSEFPNLTSYELRLCALLKINLTNKEIATILSIEAKSVKMACYRLKKKMHISEGEKLSDFLLRLDQRETAMAM